MCNRNEKMFKDSDLLAFGDIARMRFEIHGLLKDKAEMFDNYFASLFSASRFLDPSEIVNMGGFAFCKLWTLCLRTMENPGLSSSVYEESLLPHELNVLIENYFDSNHVHIEARLNKHQNVDTQKNLSAVMLASNFYKSYIWDSFLHKFVPNLLVEKKLRNDIIEIIGAEKMKQFERAVYDVCNPVSVSNLFGIGFKGAMFYYLASSDFETNKLNLMTALNELASF